MLNMDSLMYGMHYEGKIRQHPDEVIFRSKRCRQ